MVLVDLLTLTLKTSDSSDGPIVVIGYPGSKFQAFVIQKGLKNFYSDTLVKTAKVNLLDYVIPEFLHASYGNVLSVKNGIMFISGNKPRSYLIDLQQAL